MAVNGFLVDNEVQKYNYESLENYNTPDFSTSSTYQVGDYVMYQGKLYKCTTAITTGGAWDSTKWSLAILSDDVADLKSSVESGEYGLSEPVKQAILQIARKIVYVDTQGQTYYDDLYDALYPIQVVSISAVYTQSGTVYDTDTLDSLKADLVVTANYSDSSTQTVPAADYTLSGTLTAGTSTITVSYGGKTTTFNVTVTTAIWYQLTNRVLNNDGPILTGINFMENDVDITLVFDVDFAGQNTGSYWRLFTNNSAQSPYEGIYVMSHNSSGQNIRLQWMANGDYAIPMAVAWTGNFKLILVHQAGSNSMQYYYSMDNSSVVSGERTASYVHTGVEGRIGGTATVGQFKGTIHEITIYKTILSNEVISAFLHKNGTQLAAYVG